MRMHPVATHEATRLKLRCLVIDEVAFPYRGFKHRLHLLHLGTCGDPPTTRASSRAFKAVRLLQAAVPISATFTAPFFIRPDPDEDDVC
jgi:hypothetical protein